MDNLAELYDKQAGLLQVQEILKQAQDELAQQILLAERKENTVLLDNFFVLGLPPKDGGVYLAKLVDSTGEFVRTISFENRGLNEVPPGFHLAGNSTYGKKHYPDEKILGWYNVSFPKN